MATGLLVRAWIFHLSSDASRDVPETTTSPVSTEAHTSSTPACSNVCQLNRSAAGSCSIAEFGRPEPDRGCECAHTEEVLDGLADPAGAAVAVHVHAEDHRSHGRALRESLSLAVRGGRIGEPGVAEEELSPANARYIVRQGLCNRFTSEAAGGSGAKPAPADEEPLPPWLTEADVVQFASEFERTGFTGGINYYRNMDRNWELEAPWADAKVAVPTRFVDYIHKGGFKADVPLLEDVVVIPGAGHFIQQEKADEVSHHIYEFISKF
ncbi:bifunctional epoxide hydrolase 2-like [Panicum miliaceum]|uniref:Bifunctional epoxide hydrolase 2-like n=1 Tax=Panicum miliaceum TaxID=4540 RepID=A0A3L6TH31_PANMI|nr:bifunctional epoxide hydrolase 2-like [Panicum miliaceum]